MSMSQNLLSTRAFAEKAGVSAGTVSKWLRTGKIDGEKKNGKWLIAEEELEKTTAPIKKLTRAPAPAKSKKPANATAAQPGGSAYSVEAFSEMTYLTEFGVRLWLKKGRLVGAMDDHGRQGVDAVNLDHPHIKRLLR